MTFILPALLGLIVFISLALLYNNGMWSNAVRLVNIVMAGLLATNFFEPLARALDGMLPLLTYAWDFVSLWLLFIVFVLIFQILTGLVSKVNVRFLQIADRIGSVVFAAFVGWAILCFALMTLNTAPLARNFLFEGFKPGESMFMGTAPDRMWLGFMQSQSRGSFSRSVAEADRDKYGGESVAMFDPKGEFIAKYTERRAALEQNVKMGKGICPEKGAAPDR